MEQALLSELQQFVAVLKEKKAAAKYTVPEEIMKAVKKAKSLERFLHDIFALVTGSSRIDIRGIIRREFGLSEELADHMGQWARHSKELFEDELHDAIDRAEIRTGNQGSFYKGSADKHEMTEALELLRGIAHAAVRCQFQGAKAGPEEYVNILDKSIRFYALPNTYPAGDPVQYRNLISAKRLYAMSGYDETIAAALQTHARIWYQQSSFKFLERKEGYHTYEDVQYLIYALTEEQLERLRDDYIRYITQEFHLLKAKPQLYHAEYLLAMLETVLCWRAVESTLQV